MARFRSIITQLFAISHVVYCARVEFQASDEEAYRQYYNYAQLSRRLEHFAQKYPHLCELTSVGRSAGGRELWVMRITGHSLSVSEKPRFKYMGNLHEDEVLSRQVLIYLTDYLLGQYGTDPRVTELVDNTDIYILPSVNPDGFEKAVEGDCNGSKEGYENHKPIAISPYFSDQSDPSTLENAPEVVKWVLQKK